MGGTQGLLATIKSLVSANRYRLRLHAVRHMIEEGFDEENVLEAIAGRSRIRKSTVDSRQLGAKTVTVLALTCKLWAVN